MGGGVGRIGDAAMREKDRNPCVRERIKVTSKIKCGPYTQSSDVKFGIYPPSDCVKTPEDFRRLKDDLGFSYLGIYPGSDAGLIDIYEAAIASSKWRNEEILIDVQNIADEFPDLREYTPFGRSEKLVKAYNAIKGILQRGGGNFLGVLINEPSTRHNTASTWPLWRDEFYRLFKDHGADYLGSGIDAQRIFVNQFFYKSKDGSFLDTCADSKGYCDGFINDNWDHEEANWEYLSDMYGATHDVSTWINISKMHAEWPDQTDRYSQLFKTFRSTFSARSPKTIWVYPLDTCEDLLREIDKNFEIVRPDRSILKLTDQKEVPSPDTGKMEPHFLADFQEELYSLFQDPKTEIRLKPSIYGASPLVKGFAFGSGSKLRNMLTSCMRPPNNLKMVGMGGLCHCGAAQEAMCKLYCHRLYEFLDAALREGILNRTCVRIRETFKEVWECRTKPPRLWDPTDPEESLWVLISSQSLNVHAAPIDPRGDPEYGNHEEECDPPPISPSPIKPGMHVFEDPGFIFHYPIPADKDIQLPQMRKSKNDEKYLSVD